MKCAQHLLPLLEAQSMIVNSTMSKRSRTPRKLRFLTPGCSDLLVDVIMIEIKTVVVGDTDAGKTSLSERFCYGDAPMSAV
jgi:GTPase SAR1 family protein